MPQTKPARAPRDARLADVRSWAFAIHDSAVEPGPEATADRLGVFDLVVVDGESAGAEHVATLHSRGTIVLAYLSVGTIEPWRSWYSTLEPFTLDRWGDWDEYYADANQPEYREAIALIASALMDKGFDGLFLDNIDMVETHGRQTEGMRSLVSALSQDVHGRGGLLFAQNGDEFALGLAADLDGWNREDVSFGYDFDRRAYVRVSRADHEDALQAIAAMRRAGVFVTTTDYVKRGGSAEESEAVAAALDADALPYVSDIELERIPPAPFSGSD